MTDGQDGRSARWHAEAESVVPRGKTKVEKAKHERKGLDLVSIGIHPFWKHPFTSGHGRSCSIRFCELPPWARLRTMNVSPIETRTDTCSEKRFDPSTMNRPSTILSPKDLPPLFPGRPSLSSQVALPNRNQPELQGHGALGETLGEAGGQAQAEPRWGHRSKRRTKHLRPVEPTCERIGPSDCRVDGSVDE